MLKMTCCCCGSAVKAELQWYNRDNGFSICGLCVADEISRGSSAQVIHECYGIAGIHYPFPPETNKY